MNTEFDMTVLSTKEQKVKRVVKPKVELTLKGLSDQIKAADREYNNRLKEIDVNCLARTKTVANQLKKIDQSIDKRAKAQLDKQIKRIEKLSAIDKMGNAFTELQLRVEELSSRVRFQIHKETVLTEVSRFARDKGDWLQLAQFHLAIMKAFNQEDDWWDANGHEVYIGVWYDKIMKLLEE